MVDWFRLAAKEKGESFDSPIFFIYKVCNLEFNASKDTLSSICHILLHYKMGY